MLETSSHGAPQPAMSNSDELHHTLTVDDVGLALNEAGVPRSRRQIIRYCETQMLDAVKVPGPSGDQWYIAPASVPKVVGDLKQWEVQRAGHGTPRQAITDNITDETQLNSNSDTASHGAPGHATSDRVVVETEPTSNHDEGGHGKPGHAMSDLSSEGKSTAAELDTPRHAMTELDIFSHPYVLKLEAQVEKLEGKLDAQVRRTEEIQIRSQQALIELQRMVAVGQSETLANFMLKARDWVLGKGSDVPEDSNNTQTP